MYGMYGYFAVKEINRQINVILGMIVLPFTSLPHFVERHSPAEDTRPRGCNFTVFLYPSSELWCSGNLHLPIKIQIRTHIPNPYFH